MPVLIYDPQLAEQVLREREASDGDRYTEVWDGVTVMPALPNNEHQKLVTSLCMACLGAIGRDDGMVLPGANVSDRAAGWKRNYRCPDVVVVLPGSSARDCDTHWHGGPDFAVEISSPGQDPREKCAFYAAVGTRELLVIDRDPWALELFQLRNGTLESAGRSQGDTPAVLASGVLPLTFSLRPERPRPMLLTTHTATGQTWTA